MPPNRPRAPRSDQIVSLPPSSWCVPSPQINAAVITGHFRSMRPRLSNRPTPFRKHSRRRRSHTHDRVQAFITAGMIVSSDLTDRISLNSFVETFTNTIISYNFKDYVVRPNLLTPRLPRPGGTLESASHSGRSRRNAFYGSAIFPCTLDVNGISEDRSQRFLSQLRPMTAERQTSIPMDFGANRRSGFSSGYSALSPPGSRSDLTSSGG